MFRKYSVLLFIILCLSGSSYASFKSFKFAPYYSLQFTEGAAIPNKGEWMLSIDLVNDIGIMVKTDDKHKFIGFYELKYTGPGFRRQEGEKFTDRLMDHILILRHHYNINEDYTLKSQIDYMKEYKRTGTNEIWGEGLYDFSRYGLSATINREFSKELSGEFALQFHALNFPNYTDLLSEFQSGGESAEASTGKQNHNHYNGGLTVKYRENKFNTDLSLMSYQKQKVIVDTVQGDGTYYSSTKQKDSIFGIGAEREQKILNNLIQIYPKMNLKIKRSNQNYQHFETATSTVPVQYLADYYDYNQFTIAVPSSLLINKKWEFFFNPEMEFKFYTKRPPKDLEGNFVSGKQSNTLTIVSMGFGFNPNEVTRTTFFYTYQSQISNMKFEKYLPYNYDGHFFGISFNYTY